MHRNPSWSEAAATAKRLFVKWCSSTRPVDLDEIRRCITREIRAVESGKISVSPELLREMRGERITLGRIKKALAPFERR